MVTSNQDPVVFLVQRAMETSFDDLPELTLSKAKTFLLDTFGVGVIGSRGFRVEPITDMAMAWGSGDEATIWVSGRRVAAPVAAIVNAYQIHCLEFDCVSDAAVLHPLATVLSSLMAYAERRSHQGRPVDGKSFLTAVTLGVDVAVFLGLAATGPTRFFRPGVAGGFGAALALSKLEGFDRDTTIAVLGNQYAQTSGTMQSHVEGSPLLGLQVGMNSRAAIMACDLASAGILGPRDTITGQYGYARLIEGGRFDPERGIEALRQGFQIERLSHKPYPTGRLVHGSLEGVDTLRKQHGFSADEIEAITCFVPPLVNRLVARPDVARPTANYAKLCLAFIIGTLLNHGSVNVEHFVGEDMLFDPRTHEIAARVTVVQNDNPDDTAMVPVKVTVRLKSGVSHTIDIEQAFGHPDVPLSREQNVEKFWKAWRSVKGMSDEAGQRLVEQVDNLERIPDVAILARTVSRTN